MILYARQSATDNLNFTEACQEFIDRKESRRSLFRAFDNRGGSRKGTLLHLRCNFMEIVIRAPESYLLLPQSTRSTVGCRNPIKFLFIFIFLKINKWIRIWDHSGSKSAINIWLRISWSLQKYIILLHYFRSVRYTILSFKYCLWSSHV